MDVVLPETTPLPNPRYPPVPCLTLITLGFWSGVAVTMDGPRLVFLVPRWIARLECSKHPVDHE